MSLGDFATSAESLGSTSTSGTTYVPKVTLTTPNVNAGDYIIMGNFFWENPPSTNEDVQVEVEEDGTTQVFETGFLHEWPAISVEPSYRFILRRTLAAGSHTYALNFRRQNGAAIDVVLETSTLQFFRADSTVQQALSDGLSTTTTAASYSLKVSLNTGAIPAGTYRVGFHSEYRNEVNFPTGACYVRFRMRQDPAGVDTITNLMGDDIGGNELPVNNGGQGVAAGDPFESVCWFRSCLVLTADTYQFELHWRAETAGNQVDLQNSRIWFWRVA